MKPTNHEDVKTFQGMILALQHYWSSQGCAILQPLDTEVGAGTFHPATLMRAIGPEPWQAAYVQPCRRDLVHMEQDYRYLRIYPQAADKA